ncbi:hypothetical protein PIB30_017839 [Stylosanthes scabra]|uniref:Uncharacterized protein n=1 Tax=Stylosanthes scabra TaxID=79078 RepID=A0ABU6W687_9FABA|nr:hypothetical protein [Stylosanthes scabra]
MEEVKFSRKGNWWKNVLHSIRRVWGGLVIAFENRQTGLLNLQHDVRACEHEDIRVMWEMLNGNELDIGQSPKRKTKTKNGSYWRFIKWARCACRS